MKENLLDKDYFDNEILDLTKYISAYPPRLNFEAGRLALSLFRQLEQFDYLVVTGGSRPISRVLLQAAGTPHKKFITFNVEANNGVYKFDTWKRKIKLPYRAKILKVKLQNSGVDFSQKPSVCVIDERSVSGVKARDYLEQLALIPGIGKHGFAVFSIRENFFYADIKNSGNFYYPKELVHDPQEISSFFDALSRLQSRVHPEHKEDTTRFSPESLGEARLVVTKTLKTLSETISNFAAHGIANI